MTVRSLGLASEKILNKAIMICYKCISEAFALAVDWKHI